MSRERFDVEHESRRSPRHPQVRVLLLRHTVVGGVDLDQRELAGVELQALLGGLRVHRIDLAGVDQRLVDPARDAHPHGHGSIVSQVRERGSMIPPPVGRYIRYWYTYRNVVAVLVALVLSGSMFWLYTQQVTCDAHASGCLVNISVHPEDRFYGYGKPDKQVVIVGIDNQSVKSLGQYPLPRNYYADALKTLEKDGAKVVAFDVSFPDARD